MKFYLVWIGMYEQCETLLDLITQTPEDIESGEKSIEVMEAASAAEAIRLYEDAVLESNRGRPGWTDEQIAEAKDENAVLADAVSDDLARIFEDKEGWLAVSSRCCGCTDSKIRLLQGEKLRLIVSPGRSCRTCITAKMLGVFHLIYFL